MRRRPQDNLAEDTNAMPLDEAEQEAIVKELEALQEAHSRQWRITFGGIASCVGVFFLYASFSQFAHPWETRYTGEFQTVTSHVPVVLVLLQQGAALLASGWGILASASLRGPSAAPPAAAHAVQHAHRLQLLGAAGAAAAAAFWLSVCARSVRRYGWQLGAHLELLWLPLGPLAICLLVLYVQRAVRRTREEVEVLNRLRYDFKSA